MNRLLAPELSAFSTKAIEEYVRAPRDHPVVLQGLVTTDLPSAANYEGGVLYDTTVDKPKWSDGSAWNSFGPADASELTFTPAGNLAATDVQAAIEELDDEKEPTVTAGTSAQYWRGDKTWQTLNAAAVAGLGTAATQNTGTSGANVPLLNAANTWSAAQTFGAHILVGSASAKLWTPGGSGDNNLAVGAGTLASGSFAAFNNLAFGSLALNKLTSGSGNTAIGANAGRDLTTGGTNLFVGAAAGISVTTGSGNTIVGPYAGTSGLNGNVIVANGSGVIRFHHDGTDFLFPSHATTASAANAFLDSSTGALRRSTSSARYKIGIEDIEQPYLDAALAIRPVYYKPNPEMAPNDNPEHSHWGYIAEEVTDPRCIHFHDGIPDGAQYERIHVLKIEALRREVVSLEARLAALESVRKA